MSADRAGDGSLIILHNPVYDPAVTAGNGMCFDLFCDLYMALIIFAHDQRAGRIFVDPVYDHRAYFSVDPGKTVFAVK